MNRVAKGSGTSENLVHELLTQYRQFSVIIKKMGGPKGLFSQLSGSSGLSGEGANAKMTPAQMAKMNQQMAQFMPPDFLKQMGNCILAHKIFAYLHNYLGGMGGLSDMMKQLQASMGSGGSDGPNANTSSSGSKLKGRRS